jgi:hypothetical protein
MLLSIVIASQLVSHSVPGSANTEGIPHATPRSVAAAACNLEPTNIMN